MYKLVCSVSLAVCLALVFAASPATAGDWPDNCGSNKTHNFSWGSKSMWDRLLYTNQTAKGYKFLRKLSYDLPVPSPGLRLDGKITYIEALDQYHDGNGGCAYLASGGPGFVSAVLHIKSQRNQGVNFIINVWGR